MMSIREHIADLLLEIAHVVAHWIYAPPPPDYGPRKAPTPPRTNHINLDVMVAGGDPLIAYGLRGEITGGFIIVSVDAVAILKAAKFSKPIILVGDVGSEVADDLVTSGAAKELDVEAEHAKARAALGYTEKA